MPGWGLSQKLSRLIGISRAKEMSLTGNFVDAHTAEKWGLVNRVVDGSVVDQAVQLGQDSATCLPHMIEKYKTMIDDGFALSFGDGMRAEARSYEAHLASVSKEAMEKQRDATMSRGRQQKSKL
mmetsp:Transcript_61413/g.145246  ORF Transcript_61413/g.145246 Transcript_61413/m.145246 type:complete len:124 (-) Transcript_61413:1862-2233(-)